MKLSLILNITINQFTSELQQQFQEAMASAAGLSKHDTGRVALYIHSVQRRVLLSSGVGVDVTINMPNASSAATAVNLLNSNTVNQNLASANLPAATITSNAALQNSSSLNVGASSSSSSSPSSSSSSVSSSYIAAISGVIGGAGCGLLLSILWFTRAQIQVAEWYMSFVLSQQFDQSYIVL